MHRAEKIKIILSCLSGSVLEWFDFAVYGYLAPIIAGQFFPTGNPITSILLTYTVFAIGFLVRPAGAIFFGHVGDSLGRKNALILSTLMMAVPTLCMGLLPNYATLGIAAPILLVLCRLVQGFSLGGEFAGAFIYLVEKGVHGKKGFFSCWADVGCCAGMILGSLAVAGLYVVFNAHQLASYGWRLPFLSGILLSFLAWFMRRQLDESPEFEPIKKAQDAPIRQLFLQFPRVLIFASLLMAAGSLGFYLATVFIPNQLVLLGKFPAAKIYLLNTLTLTATMLGVFIAARLADYVQPHKIYMLGGLGCLLFAYPVFYALSNWGLGVLLIFLCGLGAAVGFCFGPRPLFLASIFPPGLRYSGIAMALNIANAIFGGMGPLAATWMVEKTRSIQMPACLLIGAAMLTIVAIRVLTVSIRNKKISCNAAAG